MPAFRLPFPQPTREVGRVEAALLTAILVLGGFLPHNTGSVVVMLADGNGTALRVLYYSLTMASMLALMSSLWRHNWVLFTVVAVVTASTSMWAPVVVASYVAGISYRRPAHVAWYVVAASAVTLSPEAIGAALGLPNRSWSALLPASGGIALFVVLPMVIGLWVETRRALVNGLRTQAKQVRLQHEAQVREVRARERTRIAHEMHDVVAHRVSLMVLHAGMLEVKTKDEETRQTAALIRTTGREALTQLREVLGVLRQGEPAAAHQASTLDEVDELVAESSAAGVPVRRIDHGPLPPVPTMVAQTASRVVREALTNVHKHAGAVRTEVEVRKVDNTIEVDVRNAAPVVRPEPLPGNGLGLVGLRERVEVVGGSFRAGRQPDGGWLVRVRLPYAEEAAT